MKNNIENGIYIPDENRELHTLDEWMKREDPTTAQTVVLVTDSGMLEIAKEALPRNSISRARRKPPLNTARASAAQPVTRR